MERPLPVRTLVGYARPESFVAGTIAILRRLGWRMLTPDEFARATQAGDGPAVPDLYLVDAGRLVSVPDTVRGDGAPVPIVSLVRKGAPADVDPRIVATVRSPAGTHELYRVVQQILEETPRSTPRIATNLPVECRQSGRRWEGVVVSLSENGCLLRSDTPVELGTELLLSLPVPGVGTMHLHAESAYRIKSDVGLVFSSMSPKIRESISGFVTRTLLEAA